MATDARSSAALPTGSAPEPKLVDSRIASARMQLRVVDLVSGIALLAISLLCYFLLLALIEHWLAPLGTVARYAAWLGMLIGGGYFLLVRLLPAALKPINPVFAAKTIEEGDPSLKNSLINFLLFRYRREEVRPIVYDALQSQAVSAASRISPDAVVDRSGAIRLGYVLAGCVALFGLYEVATPKAAVQTIQRVVFPWSSIAAPTRVTILEVTPGDTESYRGFTIEVTADVRGLREEEPVTLFYSTADGQIIDQPILMQPADPNSYRFTCSLPESAGLTQDVTYRIEAGDGLSPTYHVTTLAEPTIVVRSVDYQPPSYTKRKPHTVEGVGDLSALEQTLVTIKAEANYPLESAMIEFDPATSDRPKRLKLEVSGSAAEQSFRLELMPDRKAPKYSSYQIKIKTTSGVENVSPILHTIEVLPDLAPEVEILVPEARRIELPQDGGQPIEARGIDPDFGLSELTLKATVDGRDLLDESLLTEATQPRQHRTQYMFQPGKLGLPVGAEVVYWVEAADNRLEEPTQSPAANRAKTELYRIRITPPERPQQNEGNPEQNPEGGPPENNPNQGPAEGGANDNPMGEQPEEGATAEGNNAEGDPGEESSTSDESGGSGRSGESQQEGELGDDSGDQRAGNGTSPDGPKGTDQDGPGGRQSEGEGGTKAGDQTGGKQGESGGTDPAAATNNGNNPQAGGDQNEPQPGSAGGDQQRPLSADGAEDADAIERIKEYLKEQGELNSKPGGGNRNGEKTDVPEGVDTPKDPQGNAGQQDPREQAGGGNNNRDPNGSGETKPGEERNTTADNPGGKPNGTDDRRPETTSDDNPTGEKPESEGGLGDTGDSGAGKPKQNDTPGAPEAQGENRDKPKNTADSGTGDKPDEEAASPSISREQSDSEGEQGDRSGGGGEGGGQGANQEGNDSPGSNTAADEGAGASKESGEGETSDGPGGKEAADDPTGAGGEQAGNGTRNQPGTGEAPAGEGETNNQQEGDPSENQANPNNTGGKPSSTPGGSLKQGGGAPSDGNPANIALDESHTSKQEANLEYARETTNLILEKLADQEQTDQALLDRLGWTKEQMDSFVKRWKSMYDQADRGGAEGDQAREDLDQALESLGLVPESARKIETPADAVGGAVDAGFRSKPPEKYRKLYEAFRRGG